MNVQVDMLTAAFSTFGVVHNVKLVRDKGGIAVPLDPCWSLHHRVCFHANSRSLTFQKPWMYCACAVAYIKFDKASSAARAIEVMHEAVLNEGRGPLLKVFLAEAPSSRYWGSDSNTGSDDVLLIARIATVFV